MQTWKGQFLEALLEIGRILLFFIFLFFCTVFIHKLAKAF